MAVAIAWLSTFAALCLATAAALVAATVLICTSYWLLRYTIARVWGRDPSEAGVPPLLLDILGW